VKAKRFDHVAVTVSDTKRSLEFYVDQLGLRLMENHQLEGAGVDEANGLQGGERSVHAPPGRRRPRGPH
jgi:catechol 2,3-dioxygenase-like lactoylglutathione lyase family enzyme